MAAPDETRILKTIDTAPKDGRFILLAAPSGYSPVRFRYDSGRWDKSYKAWKNHSNDLFTDGGEKPTHWCEMPKPCFEEFGHEEENNNS